MPTSKTITFSWNGLTKKVKLLLCFSPPPDVQLGTDQNVVAWKVIVAQPGSSGCASIIYSGQVGFGNDEIGHGNIVASSSQIEITGGQKVKLITDADGDTRWEPPVSDPSLGQLFRAYNKTTTSRTISVGTMRVYSDGHKDYDPTFLWATVGPNMAAEAKVQPILNAYINLNYQKNQFITIDLSDDVMWSQNLSDLPENSSFVLVETKEHGYQIQPAADK
ncbi:hypothetical protein JAAARDRAFT_72520 [Jaapia argillacea MUCL 33604]|uniref:Uncharacterized protein n=1 Tax=Jaapia argillacea MUCL 33604 TaxID=933084 RepID=A0A067PFL8_9AGAM|nr:hypothetical protein JAAARDRAFT_72520 [Jaapia argillacea MUCL 33604]